MGQSEFGDHKNDGAWGRRIAIRKRSEEDHWMNKARVDYLILAIIFPVLLIAVNVRFALGYCFCCRVLICISSVAIQLDDDETRRNSVWFTLLFSLVKMINVVTQVYCALLVSLWFAKDNAGHLYDVVTRLLVFVSCFYIAVDMYRRKKRVMTVFMVISTIAFLPIERGALSLVPWDYIYLLFGVTFSVLVCLKASTRKYEL